MENTFIQYANSFQAVARLGLEGISELMQKLSNPQDSLSLIHVAGTNGKGSVCCFLQNILTDAGYKTGKFTSPNMLRVNERISIDGKDISDYDMQRLIKKVEEKAKTMSQMPTQFEIWTAAAFCFFAEQKCDFVILEVGLGGERDATNIIKNPKISVITKIAKDHTEYLGNSIEEITAAKAGIIKDGSITVTCPQESAVMKIISDKAVQKNNRLIVAKEAKLHEFNGENEIFDYGEIKNIKLSMLGEHQAQNAALAIECAKALNIGEKHIKSGILKAKNIGRLEILSKNPFIIFDGAHNKNGMNSLSKALMRYFYGKDICFIMGFMRDKDIKGAVAELFTAEIFKKSEIYTVAVENNERSAKATDLADILSGMNLKATPQPSLAEAVKKASRHEISVICGSLYLYKDYFNAL